MVGGIHKAAKDNTYNLEYINLKKTLDVNLRFLTASHIDRFKKKD